MPIRGSYLHTLPVLSLGPLSRQRSLGLWWDRRSHPYHIGVCLCREVSWLGLLFLCTPLFLKLSFQILIFLMAPYLTSVSDRSLYISQSYIGCWVFQFILQTNYFLVQYQRFHPSHMSMKNSLIIRMAEVLFCILS